MLKHNPHGQPEEPAKHHRNPGSNRTLPPLNTGPHLSTEIPMPMAIEAKSMSNSYDEHSRGRGLNMLMTQEDFRNIYRRKPRGGSRLTNESDSSDGPELPIAKRGRGC